MVIIAQAGPANTVTAAAGGVFTALGTTAQLNLNAPGSNRLNGSAFVLRASGWSTLAAGTYTATVTVTLYGVANTLTSQAIAWTAASGNAIAASSAASVTQAGTVAVTVPWVIEAYLSGDGNSGLLQGILSRAVVNNAVTTNNTAITHAPTGVAFNSEPPLQFACGAAPSANGTASVLEELVIEA
jgi:hypothetical protein